MEKIIFEILDEMADMRLEWDIYLGEREAELNSSNQ